MSHSPTLLAAVRSYFGLDQQGLALYLDVNRSYIANVETGRRPLSHAVFQRLLPLAQQLPPGPLPPLEPALELPATAPAPTADLLEARRRYCVWRAANLRHELRTLGEQATLASRWQQALPALLLTEIPTADGPSSAEMAGHRQRWLAQRAAAFGPTEAARFHLLSLEAHSLETEAVLLGKLLGQ